MLNAKGGGRLIPILIQGKPNDPEVKDLPQITEAIKDKDKRATFKAWASIYDFLRLQAFPPGTPKDRLMIMRQAFKSTLNDPQFLAEAKKARRLITYVSGKRIEELVAQMLALSPKAKENLQFLVRKKKRG